MSQYFAWPQLKLLLQRSPTTGSRQMPAVFVPPSKTMTFPAHWPSVHERVLLHGCPPSTLEYARHVRDTSSQPSVDSQSLKSRQGAPAGPLAAHCRLALQKSMGAQSPDDPLQVSPTRPWGPQTRDVVQRSPSAHSNEEKHAALAAFFARH
jgi:hypothetical protein